MTENCLWDHDEYKFDKTLWNHTSKTTTGVREDYYERIGVPENVGIRQFMQCHVGECNLHKNAKKSPCIDKKHHRYIK